MTQLAAFPRPGRIRSGLEPLGRPPHSSNLRLDFAGPDAHLRIDFATPSQRSQYGPRSFRDDADFHSSTKVANRSEVGPQCPARFWMEVDGRPAKDPRVREARKQIGRNGWASTLLDYQWPDGHWVTPVPPIGSCTGRVHRNQLACHRTRRPRYYPF